MSYLEGIMRNTEVDMDAMRLGCNSIPKVLAQLGYQEMREGQDKVVWNIMGFRDVICILPTAKGKTACFVIPTLAMGWKTLVFSPLLALMHDQITNLWKADVRAEQMSGLQSAGENHNAVRRWMSGDLDLLYVAPERQDNEQFKEALKVQPPDMIVIDEAHTLSDWSDTFRPAYCKIGELIEQYNSHIKVVAAFTATCPGEVEGDIRRVLKVPNAVKIVHYPRRENLILKSEDYISDYHMLARLRSIKGSIIIYASSRKVVEELGSFLAEQSNGNCTIYHAGLDNKTRRENQEKFMTGECPWVVATNAFGMGVDKPDIRAVVHRHFPVSMEALAQETGRAGRDGLESLCLTFNDPQSYDLQRRLIENNYPPEHDVIAAYNVIKSHSGMSADNICTLLDKEIGEEAGISPYSLQSVMSAMVSHNVLVREKTDKKLIKVKVLNKSPDMKESDLERFNLYMDNINHFGVVDSDGYIEADQAYVAEQLNKGIPTFTKWLSTWEEQGHIAYIRPPRGVPVRIVGSLADIDFDRLRRKAQTAFEKLDSVLHYMEIPDEDKHSFIEEYFEVDGS
jgi:ATP-dependent DNA helicase RecQ